MALNQRKRWKNRKTIVQKIKDSVNEDYKVSDTESACESESTGLTETEKLDDRELRLTERNTKKEQNEHTLRIVVESDQTPLLDAANGIQNNIPNTVNSSLLMSFPSSRNIFQDPVKRNE